MGIITFAKAATATTATYLVTACLTLGGIIVFPLLLAVLRVTTPWQAAKITRCAIWAYGRTWIILLTPFVRFKFEGLEDSESAGTGVIFVVNHLSFFDTFFMGGLPVFDIVFAVRSWPFKMLWFAPFMHLAGYLDVESTTPEKTFSEVSRILAEGGSVLFYPEGHRSSDGKLQRFYAGAFKVACECEALVVPLCITGTHRFLPPGRWWVLPASVRMSALPPVDSREFDGELRHRELMNRVKSMMAERIESEPSGRRRDG